MTYLITCRAQITENCFDGDPCARQFGEDLPMSEDGTFDGKSIVCDSCYVMLGCPTNAELPDAIAQRKGAP